MDTINKRDYKIIFVIENETHFMSAISLLKVISLENYNNIYFLVNKIGVRNFDGICNFLLKNNIKFSSYEFDLNQLKALKKFLIKNLYEIVKFFSKKLAFLYFWKIPKSFLDIKFEVMCSFPTTLGFKKFLFYYKPKIFFELYDGLLSLRSAYNYPKSIEQVFLVKHNENWVKESLNNNIYVKFLEEDTLKNLYDVFKISENNIKMFLQNNNIEKSDTVIIFADQWCYEENQNVKTRKFLEDFFDWVNYKKNNIKFFFKEHPRDKMKVKEKYPFIPESSLTLSDYFSCCPIEIILYSLKQYCKNKLKLVLISSHSSANFVLEDIGLLDSSLISIVNTEIIFDSDELSFIKGLQTRYRQVKILNSFDSVIRTIKLMNNNE